MCASITFIGYLCAMVIPNANIKIPQSVTLSYFIKYVVLSYPCMGFHWGGGGGGSQ